MRNGVPSPLQRPKVKENSLEFTWYLASVVSLRSDKLNHMGESMDESIDPLHLPSASPLEEFQNLGPTPVIPSAWGGRTGINQESLGPDWLVRALVGCNLYIHN